jgi:hypothetical protein
MVNNSTNINKTKEILNSDVIWLLCLGPLMILAMMFRSFGYFGYDV